MLLQIYGVTSFPIHSADAKPTLPQLLCFRTKTGDTLDITQKVGTKYTAFGLLLLNDEDGSVVTAIISQHQLNVTNIVLEILMRWVRGEGKEPTWRTLITTLSNSGLHELATCIDESL